MPGVVFMKQGAIDRGSFFELYVLLLSLLLVVAEVFLCPTTRRRVWEGLEWSRVLIKVTGE
jgi:hypothetical protein